MLLQASSTSAPRPAATTAAGPPQQQGQRPQPPGVPAGEEHRLRCAAAAVPHLERHRRPRRRCSGSSDGIAGACPGQDEAAQAVGVAGGDADAGAGVGGGGMDDQPGQADRPLDRPLGDVDVLDPEVRMAEWMR